MSVWVAIPSKRPAADVAKWRDLWRERGYKIALLRDYYDDHAELGDIVLRGTYLGYAYSVNYLIQFLIANVKDAEWFIVAGDDVEPDPNHTADEIAAQCARVFGDRVVVNQSDYPEEWQRFSTWGVMQPTGDRWGDEPWSRQRWPDAPAYIDRVLGSAWYGREYCRRMYGGKGPLFEGYTHMFEDEEAQHVALKMGVLWQRPDLIQHHHHWARKPNASDADCPAFLRKVSGHTEEGRKHWADSQLLFETRRDAGFPGHEPIA